MMLWRADVNNYVSVWKLLQSVGETSYSISNQSNYMYILSNEFNNHFATIGPKLAKKVNSSNTHSFLDHLTSTDKQFKLCPTTANKVFSLLNKLDFAQKSIEIKK